jgi:hypothetical protein
MKKTPFLLFAVVAMAFLAAHALQTKPGPDAEEFWTYITKTSPYKDWKFWDDHSGMQPGAAPHGPFHKVFVNDVLYEADSIPVPYGSIQVKESFDSEKKLTAITVMYKVKDYNPEGGDWYWARFGTEGEGGPEGKLAMCIGCHKAKAGNDYIFVHQIK